MKTYPRVVELLKEEVEKVGSIQAVSKKIGVNRTSISWYLDGVREITDMSLKKIAAYFGKSVSWCRGEDEGTPELSGLPLIIQLTMQELLKLPPHEQTRFLYEMQKRVAEIEEQQKQG